MRYEVSMEDIDEIMTFLKKAGRIDLANRLLIAKENIILGSAQYKAGTEAILEVEKALTERVPRDLILNKIYGIIEAMKKEM
jgi:hypothetical protein